MLSAPDEMMRFQTRIQSLLRGAAATSGVGRRSAGNPAPAAAWYSSEPAPLFGEETAELYSGIFNQLRPSWEQHVAAVARRAHSPGVILDLASGPGQPALLLAQTYPGATVHSTDVSESMVAQASRNVAEAGVAAQVPCAKADICNLAGFASGSVDVVTVSYGLMFVPDLDQGLAEIHRVLKPGGLLAASVWTTNPMMHHVRAIMTIVLGREPPPPPINPMSLADPEILDDALGRAGLSLAGDETGCIRFNLGRDPDKQWRLGTIPVLPALLELQASGEHGDVMAKAREAFFQVCGEFVQPDGSVAFAPADYRLVVAEK